MHGAADEQPVLHDGGLIEAELRTQSRKRLRRRIVAQHISRGIAGNCSHQEECNRDDAHDRDQKADEAAPKVAEHGIYPSRVTP